VIANLEALRGEDTLYRLRKESDDYSMMSIRSIESTKKPSMNTLRALSVARSSITAKVRRSRSHIKNVKQIRLDYSISGSSDSQIEILENISTQQKKISKILDIEKKRISDITIGNESAGMSLDLTSE
jgi:hypothetical protein